MMPYRGVTKAPGEMKINVHDYHWLAFEHIKNNPGCTLESVARACGCKQNQTLILELTYRFNVYQDEKGRVYLLNNKENEYAKESSHDKKRKTNNEQIEEGVGLRQGGGGVLPDGTKRRAWSSRETQALREESEKEAYFQALKNIGKA